MEVVRHVREGKAIRVNALGETEDKVFEPPGDGMPSVTLAPHLAALRVTRRWYQPRRVSGRTEKACQRPLATSRPAAASKRRSWGSKRARPT
jgi:hypothetical protein